MSTSSENNFESRVFSRGHVACVFGGSMWDEGKGKVVSLFQDVDIVAAPTWWANAWHTVIYKKNKIALHELPGGSIIESAKIYLGQWRVIYISWLWKELVNLQSLGIDISGKTIIAGNAHIVLKSLHIRLDTHIESLKDKKVWTTRKWIGPAYACKALRTGITFNMLLHHPDICKDIVQVSCELFPTLDHKKITAEIKKHKAQLEWLIQDGYIQIDESNSYLTTAYIQKKKILIEASQSALLAIDGGGYPYCTSSDTSRNGVLSALNIPHIHTTIAVYKAIKSKVGWWPFYTQFEDENMADAYREISGEYGSTTGRPRSVGRFDCVEARAVIARNQIDMLFITKADMLQTLPYVTTALSYMHQASKSVYTDTLPPLYMKDSLEVKYDTNTTFTQDIYGYTKKEALPQTYLTFFQRLASQLRFEWDILIGTGPERDQYIWL